MRVKARVQVQCLNNTISRVRDKIWGCNKILRWGVKFYLFSGMYRRVYMMWNFKMKDWQLINFTTCTKDWRHMQKSNIQNYHIQLITPVQQSHDFHGMSKAPDWLNAKVIPLTRPHDFYVPMCHIWIVKLPGVLHNTELGISMCMRCRLKAKIIGNCRKCMEIIGKEWKRSYDIGGMWCHHVIIC